MAWGQVRFSFKRLVVLDLVEVFELGFHKLFQDVKEIGDSIASTCTP